MYNALWRHPLFCARSVVFCQNFWQITAQRLPGNWRGGGKRFSGAFRAGTPSPFACLLLARPFFLVPTTSKRLLRRLSSLKTPSCGRKWAPLKSSSSFETNSIIPASNCALKMLSYSWSNFFKRAFKQLSLVTDRSKLSDCLHVCSLHTRSTSYLPSSLSNLMNLKNCSSSFTLLDVSVIPEPV